MGERRIAKWDNLKFWMILCVVTGHVLYEFTGTSMQASALYLFIYSFHMPVFMFVAGLFSKHAVQEHRHELIINYLLIYIIMKFLEALGSWLADGTFTFHFLWESGPAWFALALAVFLTATMILQRYDRNCILAAALLIGCLAGLDTHFGDHFASMRICVFYPVFLAGFYLDPERLSMKRLDAGKRAVLRIAALLILAGWFYYCMFVLKDSVRLLRMFKGKYEYQDMDMGMEGVILRLACYAFWALLIAVMVILVSEKERIYTWVGKRSMAIFIWHPLIIDVVMSVIGVRLLLMRELPAFYVIGAICVAVIITVLAAYLPEFRIAQRLVQGKRKKEKRG